MKVQISIDDELMKRVDNFADLNYMTRSGVFSIAVNQYVSAHEVTNAIINMSLACKKLADTGKVDPELLEQIEDFDRLARMLVVSKDTLK